MIAGSFYKPASYCYFYCKWGGDWIGQGITYLDKDQFRGGYEEGWVEVIIDYNGFPFHLTINWIDTIINYKYIEHLPEIERK